MNMDMNMNMQNTRVPHVHAIEVDSASRRSCPRDKIT